MSFKSGSRRFPLLVAGLLLTGLLGLPAGAVAVPAPAPTRTAALTTAQFEARLVALTNARRKKIGCPALKANSALVAAARKHTVLMMRAGKLSHQLPKEAGLAARIVHAGYKHWKLLAENIAWGQRATPAAVFTMWMNSSPHRANIQNCRVRDVGYGVRYGAGEVWVTGDYGRH